MTIARLKSCKVKLKKTDRSKNNIFTIYSPKKAIIETADTVTIGTELILKLPPEANAFVVTKFTRQNIEHITGPKKKRLWITLLNESYFEKHSINKGDHIRYLVIEPETLKGHYEAKEKQPRQKAKHPSNYLPKDWEKRRKKYWQKKKDASSTDRRFSQSV